MGDSPDAGVASLRTSVVSLTNGPSIMILGRLGVSRPRFACARPDPYRSRDFSLGMIRLATTLVRYARKSLLSVFADCLRDFLRRDVQRGGAQGNVPLSWGDAKSPIPGQVYVTAQATRG